MAGPVLADRIAIPGSRWLSGPPGTQALANAVARRGEVAGCVLHSDRGSQFPSRKFVLALGRNHMFTWIERTYHRRRRQSGLGRLTPIESEAIMTRPASQAA